MIAERKHFPLNSRKARNVMNFKHLEAFINVAEYGSFSSAADRMFVSSPALQQQINRLESEIGFRLFDRGPGGVQLTAAGRVFFEGARDIQHNLTMLLEKCRETAASACCIRVGAIAGLMPDLFPRITGPFRAKYPQVRQKPVMESEEQLFSDLDSGLMDVVEYFDAPKAHAPGRCYLPLVWEGRDCVMSPNHPLAGREELTLADLRGQRLVVYRFDRIPGFQEYVHANYPEIELSEGNKCADYYSLVRMFEEGYISLAPPHNRGIFSTLATVPLKMDMRWSVGLVYRENPSEIVKNFLDTAKAAFADQP